MTARRSTSDPVSEFLDTGERVVWRHQPAPRILFINRLPGFVMVLLMTCFVAAIGVNVIGSALGPGPIEPSPWLVLPAAAGAFFFVLLYVFLRFLWSHIAGLADSWSTHYALTDRRFLVVSKRGVVAYDASYFRMMDARGGAPGGQTLLFDYRVARRRKHNGFRDRIAALPDSKKLEQLIRQTLLEASASQA